MGGSAISLCVAGLTIRAESEAEGPRLVHSRDSASFLADALAPASLSLQARWGSLSTVDPGQILFETAGTWRLFRSGDTDILRTYLPARNYLPAREVRLSRSGMNGEIILDPSLFSRDGPVDVLQFPLEELLYIRILAGGLGIEFHACGLVDEEGNGFLFVGQSGDGKTTTARLWEVVPGTRILSDDRIIVRHVDGLWRMYGTPWHGEADLALNASVPLTAIFVLDRGSTNEFSPLSQAEAAALLFARSFVPFHDAESLAWAAECCGNLAAALPCTRFSFVPTGAACEAVSRKFGRSDHLR
jgi:hypothetical protein